jgi:sulfate transport system ATP-binding protein
LHHDINVTSVFVTHDQEEALEIADRVVVMNQGRIEQVGTPEEVYERPASAFVHEFIGESIAVPLTVRAGAVLFGGRPLAVDAADTPDGAARLFVRPDEMAVVTPDKAVFTGEVRHIHGLGPDRRITVALSGMPETAIEIAVPRGAGPRVGETVGLAPRKYRIFAIPG